MCVCQWIIVLPRKITKQADRRRRRRRTNWLCNQLNICAQAKQNNSKDPKDRIVPKTTTRKLNDVRQNDVYVWRSANNNNLWYVLTSYYYYSCVCFQFSSGWTRDWVLIDLLIGLMQYYVCFISAQIMHFFLCITWSVMRIGIVVFLFLLFIYFFVSRTNTRKYVCDNSLEVGGILTVIQIPEKLIREC